MEVNTMVRKILLLGDEQLYEVSAEVDKKEISQIRNTITNLHDTLMDYRNRYGAGRAIAAPQIGIQKRIIYMFLDHPVVFINPVLKFPDEEMMEVLDDCMSFPDAMAFPKESCCLERGKCSSFGDGWPGDGRLVQSRALKAIRRRRRKQPFRGTSVNR
jgi:hypothetical protein